MENKRPRVEVIMKNKNGKIVLEKLLDPKYPQNLGKTRLPGGKIEEGETPEEALVREMMEEYKLSINPADLVFYDEGESDNATSKQYILNNFEFDLDDDGRYSDTGLEQLLTSDTVPKPWV